MAPAGRKEREPEYSRISTGATELDSPPKRMASDPMYTSKEHGELGHGLRGTNLPAEKLQPLIPDRAIVKDFLRTAPAPLGADSCQGCRPGEGI